MMMTYPIRRFMRGLLSGLTLLAASSTAALAAPKGVIDVWYGTEQTFGYRGKPQRWVNILGSVSSPKQIIALEYTLNGGPRQPLSMGPDLHRLAAPGDFNVELAYADLKPGHNHLTIIAADTSGGTAFQDVLVKYLPDQTWPLPYSIDWNKVPALQDAVQIVDGHWKLVPGGVRTERPYYDRVLAVGDLSWTNYEVTAAVTFHGFTGPTPQGPHYGVTHAGIGLRWTGHHDDGKQPRVQWHPLGAAAEFQLFQDLSKCHWRILADQKGRAVSKDRTRIVLGRTYVMKARVESLARGQTRYQAKIWPAGEAEPRKWAVESMEGPEDVSSGCLLLVAHNSDVTFGNLEVKPLP